MVSLSMSAHAVPNAMVQSNFPVIALGETAELNLQLAPHPGGLVTYSIHTNVYASEENSGYRVLDVRCPPGFLSNVYQGKRRCGVLSHRGHAASGRRDVGDSVQRGCAGWAS